MIGQFAAGSGKKAGKFYTPRQISTILSEIVTLDSQYPCTDKKSKLDNVLDFACGSGSLLLNVRKRIKKNEGSVGKIYCQEKEENSDYDSVHRENKLLRMSVQLTTLIKTGLVS